jgi:hypothetical protein
LNFSFTQSSAQTYGKSVSTLQSEGWITSDGVLAPEHDAAQAHWGGDWRMPTKEELDALNSNCDWTWTTQNGMNGYVVRGRGEYASNSIFLPTAGFGYGASLRYSGSNGHNWSSVPRSYYDSDALDLSFYSSDYCTYYNYPYYGQSIRPVREVSSSNILSMSGLKAAYFFDGNLNDSYVHGYDLSGQSGSFVADRNGDADSAQYFDGNGKTVTTADCRVEAEFTFAFWCKTSVTMSENGSGDNLGSWSGNYILFPQEFSV